MSAVGTIVGAIVGLLMIVLGLFTVAFPFYVVYEVLRVKIFSGDEDSSIRYKRLAVLSGLMFSLWALMIMGGAIFATVQGEPEDVSQEPVAAFDRSGVYYEPPEDFSRQKVRQAVNFYSNTSGVNLVVKRTTVNRSVYNRYEVLDYIREQDDVYSASNETLVEVENRTFHRLRTTAYRAGSDVYTITYSTHIGDGEQLVFQAYSTDGYPQAFALQELREVQLPN